MKDKKVVKMPGVYSTEEPLLTQEHFKVEQEMVSDLEDLIHKYNGRVSNIALIGALSLYSNMVSIGSLEVFEDE